MDGQNYQYQGNLMSVPTSVQPSSSNPITGNPNPNYLNYGKSPAVAPSYKTQVAESVLWSCCASIAATLCCNFCLNLCWF